MAVKIGSARIDENGRISGGKAGDQTGNEVGTQSWYKHGKGWRCLRAKDPIAREFIAQAMEAACANNNIGYDQNQRNSLYNAIKDKGFDPARCNTKVETDCSALVRVCCAHAGIKVSDFNTANEAAVLLKSGAFVELDSKYCTSSVYLLRGDILVTKTKGHTVVVLSNGTKTVPEELPKVYNLGDRELSKGCSGNDVKTLQNILIDAGYSVGKCGADGDFGKDTETAVKAYQNDHGLEADGVAGEKTFACMIGVSSNIVRVNVGVTLNIRKGAGKAYAATGKYALANSEYRFTEKKSADGVDWYHIDTGWISGKYCTEV